MIAFLPARLCRYLLATVLVLLLLSVRPGVGRAVTNGDVLDLLELLEYTFERTARASHKARRTSSLVKKPPVDRRDTCGCHHGCNFNHPLDCARCCVQVL